MSTAVHTGSFNIKVPVKSPSSYWHSHLLKQHTSLSQCASILGHIRSEDGVLWGNFWEEDTIKRNNSVSLMGKEHRKAHH